MSSSDDIVMYRPNGDCTWCAKPASIVDNHHPDCLVAEIERLRAALARCNAETTNTVPTVRCYRHPGHEGDHVGCFEEYWWSNE